MKTKLSNVSSKYGASMGRDDSIPSDINTAGKLHLKQLKWIDGDYDEGGAYWGQTIGEHIFWATGESATQQIEIFVRAKNRNHAKSEVKNVFPEAKFFR